MKATEIRIADPCGEDLDRMPRSPSGRFCSRCQRKVHDLSSMTRTDAQAFLTGADDICVSYVYDDNGEIVFRSQAKALLLARRDDARRLLTVVATVPIMAAAACNRAEPTRSDALAIAAASGSAAQCDDPVQIKKDEVSALKTSLNAAKDEEERAELVSKLSRVQQELKSLGGPDPKHHMVAGKMVRRLPGDKPRTTGSPCNCPPNDPLCSCL